MFKMEMGISDIEGGAVRFRRGRYLLENGREKSSLRVISFYRRGKWFETLDTLQKMTDSSPPK